MPQQATSAPDHGQFRDHASRDGGSDPVTMDWILARLARCAIQVHPEGYPQVYVGKGHHLGGKKGVALLHRLAAEAKLGRRLADGEVVHHINGDKTDWRPENLMVFASHAEHNVEHRRVNFDLRMPGEDNPDVACECGCGETFPKFDEAGRPRRYLVGHRPIATPVGDLVREILANSAAPVTADEVASVTGQRRETARQSLTLLVRQGEVVRVGRGRYSLRVAR